MGIQDEISVFICTLQKLIEKRDQLMPSLESFATADYRLARSVGGPMAVIENNLAGRAALAAYQKATNDTIQKIAVLKQLSAAICKNSVEVGLKYQHYHAQFASGKTTKAQLFDACSFATAAWRSKHNELSSQVQRVFSQ
jgi:hypothetical protein